MGDAFSRSLSMIYADFNTPSAEMFEELNWQSKIQQGKP